MSENKNIITDNHLTLLIAVLTVAVVVMLLFSGKGREMRNVDLGDGISLGVPGNFPKQVIQEKNGEKIVSFSMRPHPDAPRFLSFFEIVVSGQESDLKKILPAKGYVPGIITHEALTIHGETASLSSGDLEITLPCGSKQSATLYILNCHFRARNKYLTIVTFSMTKKGLLDIIRTIKCQSKS